MNIVSMQSIPSSPLLKSPVSAVTMMTSSNGNKWSPVNSPHKSQWHGALMFCLICVWINDWVNKREAGDLRCYRTHYDVSVMKVWCPLAIVNMDSSYLMPNTHLSVKWKLSNSPWSPHLRYRLPIDNAGDLSVKSCVLEFCKGIHICIWLQ